MASRAITLEAALMCMLIGLMRRFLEIEIELKNAEKKNKRMDL